LHEPGNPLSQAVPWLPSPQSLSFLRREKTLQSTTKDVMEAFSALTSRAEVKIVPSRIPAVPPRKQRELSTAIKRRALNGLLPYVVK